MFCFGLCPLVAHLPLCAAWKLNAPKGWRNPEPSFRVVSSQIARSAASNVSHRDPLAGHKPKGQEEAQGTTVSRTWIARRRRRSCAGGENNAASPSSFVGEQYTVRLGDEGETRTALGGDSWRRQKPRVNRSSFRAEQSQGCHRRDGERW